MLGVLMSVHPLKPTSFQPRSSATMWTMLGFLSAACAACAAEGKPLTASATPLATLSVLSRRFRLPGSPTTLKATRFAVVLISFSCSLICRFPFVSLISLAGRSNVLHAPESDMVAGGADLAFAARSDHVARAILVRAEKRAPAM